MQGKSDKKEYWTEMLKGQTFQWPNSLSIDLYIDDKMKTSFSFQTDISFISLKTLLQIMICCTYPL